jgi:hypothetical protein
MHLFFCNFCKKFSSNFAARYGTMKFLLNVIFDIQVQGRLRRRRETRIRTVLVDVRSAIRQFIPEISL